MNIVRKANSYKYQKGVKMENMTDYQLQVILQLIIDKLANCKTLEDYELARKEIEEMRKSK